MFNLHYCGHQIIENPPFIIDRPEGSYRYIFFHFISAVQVLDANGLVEAPPGSCILYTPGKPQKIIASHARLNHDYLDFVVDDPNLFKTLKFPLNTVFKPWMSKYISNTIQQIFDEKNNMIIGCEYIISSLMTNMFVNLSRKMHNYSADSLQYNEELKDRFEKLRLMVYENPMDYDVAKMAEIINFSRSHFNMLYKEFFDVTPIQDLTNAKIEKVKTIILQGKTMDIVSKEIGFESVEYFFRWFKRHFQCTPSEYIKKIEKEQQG